MGLKLPPSQFIHQKKAYALENKKMHVTKALSVNLAIFREEVYLDLLSGFPSKKVGHFFLVLHASKSHLINYS